MSLLHSSTRRPAPLKDIDYDHEIVLVDHTQTITPTEDSSRSQDNLNIDRRSSPIATSDSTSRRHSDVPLRKHASKKLRQQVVRRKYGKFKGQVPVEDANSYDEASSETETDGRSPRASREHQAGQDTDGGMNGSADARGRSRHSKSKDDDRESAIDILFENQRGGFLCGIPLFSSKALGNLDPAPWTNVAQKTSATNPTNAQVPDPSWEWAWKEWLVNHTDEVDEGGWEYSFAFAKQFSWHGPSWWNSFVRRRAWIRKRVKKTAHPHVLEAHMLNSDYFTIHPVVERSRSRDSTDDRVLHNRYSIAALAKQEMEQERVLEDVTDIASLMKALKLARIDREKMEIVESFIEHGGEELYYLRDKMHEIMGMFIFQASRKLLLAHLLKILNDATEQQQAGVNENYADSAKTRRLENLQAAVEHAEEEVKRLEFWSDVKDIAEKGETKGAVDKEQGWDDGWAGLDRSGPDDVISKQNAIGSKDCPDDDGNGPEVSNGPGDKGKGKAE